MSTQFTLPELGEGVESGDVVTIFVREGDQIQAEQDVIELETEKAVVGVPCPYAGRVSKVHVSEGDTVAPGGVILTIEVVAADKPAPQPPAAKPAAKAAEISVPAPSVASPPPAPPVAAASPIRPPVELAEPTASSPAPAPPLADNRAASAGIAPAGPSVRRFARQLGVDLSAVTGTGPDGRITERDVRAAVRQATSGQRNHQGTAAPVAAPKAAAATADAAPVEVPGEPGTDAWGPVRRQPMSKIRQTIARKMSESKSTAPHVTNFDDADVTQLESIRQESKADYAAQGLKLTTMPFIIKACALSLRRHPVVNSTLDEQANEIVYKQYTNVGIAVDTQRGLVVPVMRDADQLSVPQIAKSLAEMADKVRQSAYTLDDLRGGSFTISNLGAIGGTYSTPVINFPEVAILLVGRSRKMAVVHEDQIVPRLMMPLSLSYDHRVVDGANAARFLNEVKGYLETPSRLLLTP